MRRIRKGILQKGKVRRFWSKRRLNTSRPKCIFRKLRLSGFKSFLDPVEVQIEDGISGVVGPNGCGKSNVVEALKWVMGETSVAQVMRGGEMDDVIFGGTADRPAQYRRGRSRSR